MAARQRIVRVRRDYNRWVANQTLEDYALRFTAKSARRWSAARVANTALGAASFLALEAIGGGVTLTYGFANAMPAILAAGALIFLSCVPISLFAARHGVDVDLLTRGAGFGYIGSTVTSLIYASFTFLFFAIETAIVAAMLHNSFGLPLPLGYLLCSLAVIPLATHGFTFISRLQLWSQPLWLVLQAIPFVAIAYTERGALHAWTHYAPPPGPAGGFDVLAFGAAASVIFALVAQVGEQADVLRFLRPPRDGRARGRFGWMAAMLAGGPGWVLIGVVKLLAGSFLAVLAVRSGLAPRLAGEPGEMYRLAFAHVVHSPLAATALAAVFVVVSQVKINVTNAYAGSIAWSNFFSRLTHRHPGRVVWLSFNIGIAVLLLELGFTQVIERTLAVFSMVAAAWVGALVADLVVNKPLGLSPAGIEFKRAHLYDVNPVGTGAMLLAVGIGALAHSGGLGALARAFAPFLAFAAAFAAAPVIAWATGGRFYLARRPRPQWQGRTTLTCCLCENPFEPEDMAFCPVYSGPICSLCCSLDARCHDGCKPHARAGSQLAALGEAVLPASIVARLGSSLARFAALLALFLLGVALVASARLSLVVLAPLAVLAACLVVLAQDSRRAAEIETERQTTLLMAEIGAHERTDAKLQRAKEVAEAANLAKSRFVVGLSHELRSPLNAILGYAQLLERDAALPEQPRERIGIIRRSGEHLAGLIDGLLDVSKIEAGRIELAHDAIALPEFIAQLAGMFRLQAEAKGLGFSLTLPAAMPQIVHADERRLRQILINLLSNAIKFTAAGQVSLTLRHRHDIAEFDIEDTGIGIAPADHERIFQPFERVEHPPGAAIPGIGLGLTITRLLCQIMGGELTLVSAAGSGSRFRVRLMLSAASRDIPAGPPAIAAPTGYAGPQRRVLVADDDADHRRLLQDLLEPLGFAVFTAADGAQALAMAEACQPDLLLVDISMPGLDGWSVAASLRQRGFDRLAIIVISANAGIPPRPDPESDAAHDDLLEKPVVLAALLERIGAHLGLDWQRPDAPPKAPPAPPCALTADERAVLGELAAIGYQRGLLSALDAIAARDPVRAEGVATLRRLVAGFELDAFVAALEAPEILPQAAQ